MKNTSKKKATGNVHKLSKEIMGKELSHAFKMLRTAGIEIRVIDIDGVKVRAEIIEKDPNRICVQVINGYVKRSWIG